jgi:hypothetical protein
MPYQRLSQSLLLLISPTQIFANNHHYTLGVITTIVAISLLSNSAFRSLVSFRSFSTRAVNKGFSVAIKVSGF